MTGWERKHPACRLPAERGKRTVAESYPEAQVIRSPRLRERRFTRSRSQQDAGVPSLKMIGVNAEFAQFSGEAVSAGCFFLRIGIRLSGCTQEYFFGWMVEPQRLSVIDQLQT